MTGFESTKFYARVALMRRRLLLRQMIRRALAGTLAVAALIVAASFATRTLYLALLAPLGELGATGVLAGGYLVLAVGLLLFALSEPGSAEMTALTEMEEIARARALAETQGTVAGVEGRIESLGSSISVGLGLLGMLRRIMARKKAAE